MHLESTKHQFIELRAQGLSLAGIAEKIGVSKRTLIDWNREHQAQIDSLRAAELEALHERILASHEQELTRLAAFQRQIEAELEKRSVKALSMEKLFRLSFQVRREIRHLCATARTSDLASPPKGSVALASAARNAATDFQPAKRPGIEDSLSRIEQPPVTSGQSSPIKPNQAENIFSAPESRSHRREEVDSSSVAAPKFPSAGGASNSASALADSAPTVSQPNTEPGPGFATQPFHSEPEPSPLINTPIHRGENDPSTAATVSTVSNPPDLEPTTTSLSDNSKIENPPEFCPECESLLPPRLPSGERYSIHCQKLRCSSPVRRKGAPFEPCPHCGVTVPDLLPNGRRAAANCPECKKPLLPPDQVPLLADYLSSLTAAATAG